MPSTEGSEGFASHLHQLYLPLSSFSLGVPNSGEVYVRPTNEPVLMVRALTGGCAQRQLQGRNSLPLLSFLLKTTIVLHQVL
jgi:hypothetical protein